MGLGVKSKSPIVIKKCRENGDFYANPIFLQLRLVLNVYVNIFKNFLEQFLNEFKILKISLVITTSKVYLIRNRNIIVARGNIKIICRYLVQAEDVDEHATADCSTNRHTTDDPNTHVS